jgi:hypothetical protein
MTLMSQATLMEQAIPKIELERSVVVVGGGQVSDPGLFSHPLFTEVRSRGILGGSPAESCIVLLHTGPLLPDFLMYRKWTVDMICRT